MAEDKDELNEKKGAGEEGGEGTAELGGEHAPKKSPKKIIIMAAVGVLVVVLGITGAYFMGFLDGMFPHKKDAAAGGDELACEKVKEGDEKYELCKQKDPQAMGLPGVFVNIPDMIVNLKSDLAQPRFLKISIDVELQSETDKAKFSPLMPRVIDQFQMYLRELRFEDLKGTAGIYRMKIELLNRIRSVTPSIKVSDILFQEILVQ